MNVVGIIRGSEIGDEVIYVTSHHDTWFVGAQDNNSTTAALLEVARWFHEHRPRRTVRFVVFGSEESGFPVGEQGMYYDRGSYCYTVQHEEEVAGTGPTRAHIILNGEFAAYVPHFIATVSPGLGPWAREIAGDLGPGIVVNEMVPRWTGSDHVPFHALGLPGVFILPPTDEEIAGKPAFWPLYHTPEDNLGTADSDALAAYAQLVLLMALRQDEADVPVSVPDLVAAAQRGTGGFTGADELTAALRAATERCENGSAVVRRHRAMDLARLCNRGLYAFAQEVFVHKFEFADTAIRGLRDAAEQVGGGADAETVRATLLRIPGVAAGCEYSHEIYERMAVMCAQSPIMSRLTLVYLDLHDVLDALGNTPVSAVTEALNAKAVQLQHQAQHWIQSLTAQLQDVVATWDLQASH
jgi:hypothetical protein